MADEQLTDEARAIILEERMTSLEAAVHRLSVACAKRVARDVANGARTLTPDLQEWFDEHRIGVQS